MTLHPLSTLVNHRWQRALWVLVALTGVLLAAVRTVRSYHPPGPHDVANQGMVDFHNGIYFPSRAWLDGVSPYSQAYAKQYPVARRIPAFSPAVLLLHAPLSLLPLPLAEIIYFAIMLTFVWLIAWVIVRDTQCIGSWPVVAVFASMLFTRGGHITLYNGYFTFEMVLASLLAIRYSRSNPWLAALALAITSCKPNYFLPLALLLAARGDWRVVGKSIPAILLLAAVAFAQIYPVSTQGLSSFVADVAGGQQVHMSEQLEIPADSWTRIDLLTIAAKITGENYGQTLQLATMFVLLAAPAFVLWRFRRRLVGLGPTHLQGSLIIVASLMSVYHHAYDSLLLLAPTVGLAVGVWCAESPLTRWQRWLLLALLLFPQLNLASTETVLSRIDAPRWIYQIITSSNAAVIAVACVAIMVVILRLPPPTTDHEAILRHD